MAGWNGSHGCNTASTPQKPSRHKGERPSRLRGLGVALCFVLIAGFSIWFCNDHEKVDAGAKKSHHNASIKEVLHTTSTESKIKSEKVDSPNPQLPVPKISNKRIESRTDIVPPQPLEEMEAALTNKPPKKKVAFSNGAEQLIAMATPSTPGAFVPPLPDITNEGVARDVEKALKNAIKAEDGDDIALLEKKLVVAEAKEEFRELNEKEGWGFAEYVNALRDKANLDAEFLGEAHKIATEIYHDETISDEDYIKYRDQINEKLRERGLPEIDSEEE